MHEECDIVRPRLIIALGKLAISQFLPVKKPADVVGDLHAHTLTPSSAEELGDGDPASASPEWRRHLAPARSREKFAGGSLGQI
jgi:uracil-DNA glycosylase